MTVLFTPARLSGDTAAIPSKSEGHRLLLLSALAEGETQLAMLGPVSEDIRATARCIEALGGRVRYGAEGVVVTPISRPAPDPALDCGESGATLRFLLPVAAALTEGFSVTGRGRLPRRPLGELCRAMEEGGCAFSAHALPLRVSGRLRPGEYTLPGNVSSQYISGLLMALPLPGGESRIRLTTPLESAGYVEMTMAAMARFGVNVERLEDGFALRGGGYVSPGRMEVEGDWSAGACWLAARSLGHEVKVTGLSSESLQPDRTAAQLMDSLGGGAEVDVSQCPDLLPILAVRAAYCEGETRFVNAARLRAKESDRLHAAALGLGALGAEAEAGEDCLLVRGRGALGGGEVSSFGDHRMAMAWAVAALNAGGPVRLTGAEAVDKSYPGFWREYERLGGNCHVL